MLQFMRSQRVGHDWATELNWTEYNWTYTPKSVIYVLKSQNLLEGDLRYLVPHHYSFNQIQELEEYWNTEELAAGDEKWNSMCVNVCWGMVV